MSIDVEFAVKKDIRNNAVVRDLDPRQRQEFRRTSALAGLIVAMLLFSGWQHYQVRQNGYTLESLRRERAAEEAINRQLRLEREMRRAPQWIEQRAISELHMVTPATRDTLVIERATTAVPDKTVVASVR